MLKLRKAQLCDDLNSLILSASGSTFKDFGIDDLNGCCDYLYHQQNNVFSYENCQVLLCDDVIVGMVIIYHHDQELVLAKNQKELLKEKYQVNVDVGMIESLEDSYYIDTLAITPTQQGQGYGKFLVKELLKQYPKISLIVDLDKPRVIKLYQNLGFKIVEEVSLYDEVYYQMIS